MVRPCMDSNIYYYSYCNRIALVMSATGGLSLAPAVFVLILLNASIGFHDHCSEKRLPIQHHDESD